MIATIFRRLAIALCLGIAASFLFVSTGWTALSQSEQAAAPGAASRRIGAIKSINGSSITLAPDSGADVNVTVQPATRIVRIAPGEKDLKNSTPIQLQDLQVG